MLPLSQLEMVLNIPFILFLCWALSNQNVVPKQLLPTRHRPFKS
ncbi:Uncharacterised protein [Vibrio cholerae]|nr:Uncharacterised protein [Vibrio cholerae]